jgi:putative flavoprotein involved in K+ transport
MRPKPRILDAAIIGAGPAGVGVGLALRGLGGLDIALVDQERIGESFRRWPKGMRLITPSFTGNQYGALDLNSVHPSTSPAFNLKTEHPTGPDYARYLEAVAAWGQLPVLSGHKVQRLLRRPDGIFELQLGKASLQARNVVWAGGEFGHPKAPGFPGAELGRHNSAVREWAKVPGKRSVVIGGYESGIDAAFHLVQAGKQVTVLDPAAPWASEDSDPSVTLSPYTLDRLRVALASRRLKLIKAGAQAITAQGRAFKVKAGPRWLPSDSAPILATGFQSSLKLIEDLFHWDKGIAQVRLADDQSTKTPGLYLAGPSLRHHHDGKLLVFCFIYKFRGRFPIVAQSIGRRLKAPKAALAHMTGFFKQHKMYLDDLSCCGDDCAC